MAILSWGIDPKSKKPTPKKVTAPTTTKPKATTTTMPKATTTTTMPKAPSTTVGIGQPKLYPTTTTTMPRATITTMPKATVPPVVPRVSPQQQKALLDALQANLAKQKAAQAARDRLAAAATVRASGGRVLPRVPAAIAPVTQVQGTPSPVATTNSATAPVYPTALSSIANDATGGWGIPRPASIPPADWHSMTRAQKERVVAAQGNTVTSQTPFDTTNDGWTQASTQGVPQGAVQAQGGGSSPLSSLGSLGINDVYDVLFNEGQQREAERKALYTDLLSQIQQANADNQKDLIVPTDESQWTGEYDAAIGDLLNSRDQLSSDVNGLFQQQLGTIQDDQNRYLSSLNRSGAAATSGINTLASQLQAKLGVDSATAAQIASQYQTDAGGTNAVAAQQGVANNPLVQQQQAAVAVQNAYKASGFTAQEIAAMANQYAGKVAQSVASSKADSGVKYVQAYNDAFNNQKKAVTDIFSQFNKGLSDLLSGKTTAKSKFVAANQSGVNIRGNQNNDTFKVMVDAIDKMERADPYLAQAMTDVAANVRNQQTIQGAAERNAATIAGANARSAASIAAANGRAAARLAAKGGGGGGSGTIPVKPLYVDNVGKYVANKVDTGVMGPKLGKWIRSADMEAQDMVAAAKANNMNVSYSQAVATAIRNRTGKWYNKDQAKIIQNHITMARQGSVMPVRKKY